MRQALTSDKLRKNWSFNFPKNYINFASHVRETENVCIIKKQKPFKTKYQSDIVQSGTIIVQCKISYIIFMSKTSIKMHIHVLKLVFTIDKDL